MEKSNDATQRMPGSSWQHFPHGADLGVRGCGPTVETAFEQAALALTAAVTTAQVKAQIRVDTTCTSGDLELLFVAWLNAVIYEMAVRDMLFGRFEVHIDGNTLTGSMWGEEVDRARHEPACEPKGATFTELKVARDADGVWCAGCVIDV